jgi:hypothetical protein
MKTEQRMGPFDIEMRRSISEARVDSLRRAMQASKPRQERPPRKRPVRSFVGRGLISLGERLEPIHH